MSAAINLVGPSTSPGAPLITPTAINTAVNAALAADAATAAAASAALQDSLDSLTSADILDFSAAVSATSPVRAVSAGLVINSGTLAPVLGGGLAVVGGTIISTGTVGSVNLTSATGLSINGQPVINIDGLNNTVVGFSAGGGTLMTGGLNTMFGWRAGASDTTGNENTFIGYLTGEKVTTGSFLTGCGEHTLGSEIVANFSTAIGNDSQRNVISNSSGGNTSVGKNSQYIHGGINNTSVGLSALVGNGTCVMLGGTATAGDVISLTVTGSFAGSPQTVSTTVTAAQSLGSMATALYAAFIANTALLNLIGQGSHSGVFDTSNINLNWYQVAIPDVIVTASVSGAATETVTILGGATGFNNVALGKFSMQGLYWTTAHDNVAIGTNTLYAVRDGANDIAIGNNAGRAVTTGHDMILIGANAGDAITTGSFHVGIGSGALGAVTTGGNDIAIGLNAGAAITTGGNNVIIGPSVGSTTLTTGNGNIYLGAGSAIDAASGSESNTFRLGAHATNTMRATGINSATPAFFLDWLPASSSYVDDAAAATGGIAVGQIYRNGSAVMCRVA